MSTAASAWVFWSLKAAACLILVAFLLRWGYRVMRDAPLIVNIRMRRQGYSQDEADTWVFSRKWWFPHRVPMPPDGWRQ